MPAPATAPLAVTMGEPAGIGPELVARLWRERRELALPAFVYIGCANALKAHDSDLPIKIADDTCVSIAQAEDTLTVIDVPTAELPIPGNLNPANGAAVIESIDRSVRLVREGKLSGLVTAPIHKAALYGCGFDAPGHTEYLARLCGLADTDSVMMLATEGLRVVPVTVHVPLKDVPRTLTAERIIHAGLVTAHDLRKRFGQERPRLAVAGLNPHAGEDGTIGMEESTHIMPAIWALRDAGIEVTDPQPADTLFHADARELYDAALCMYHDQALIPLKTLDFWGGINATLGLPIIRTSPDHGTALSLAGTGKCRPDSMIAAMKMASQMAERVAQNGE